MRVLKQMDSPLELFVVHEGEEIYFYTVYSSNVREGEGDSAFKGKIPFPRGQGSL